MIGCVAYALYKRSKHVELRRIREKYGRAASSDEVETFIGMANQQVAAYRSMAESALEKFSDVVLSSTLEAFQAQSDEEVERKLSQQERRFAQMHKSFWRAVGEHLVASVLTWSVVALITLVVVGARYGFLPLIGDVFGYEIKHKQTESPSSAERPTSPTH